MNELPPDNRVSEPPIDPAVLNELRQAVGTGPEDGIAVFVDLFLDAARDNLEAIQIGLRDDSAADVRMAAHRLRGNCGTVGAVRVARVAARLETQATRGDLKAASQHLGPLTAAIREAEAALGRAVGD